MKRLKRILKHISDNDIIYSFLAPMIIIMVAWQVLLVVDFMGNINWLIKINSFKRLNGGRNLSQSQLKLLGLKKSISIKEMINELI